MPSTSLRASSRLWPILVFGGQGGTEALLDPAAVLVPHQLQDLTPQLFRLRVIAAPARSSML